MPYKSQLTEEMVIEARRTKSAYGAIRALAKRFGVGYMALYNARRGRSFKHLNEKYPPQRTW